MAINIESKHFDFELAKKWGVFVKYSTPSLELLSFEAGAISPSLRRGDLELRKQLLGAIQSAFDRSGMSGDELNRIKLELLEIAARGTIAEMVCKSLDAIIDNKSVMGREEIINDSV